MERPKSGWDTYEQISEASLAEAERRLKGLDLKLEDDFPADESDTVTPPNGADYLVEKKTIDIDTVEPEVSPLEVADGIITGQEQARIINNGTAKERLVFPPIEGQEISVEAPHITPEQIAANTDPFQKMGKDALTPGPNRAPVQKPAGSFFKRLFGVE